MKLGAGWVDNTNAATPAAAGGDTSQKNVAQVIFSLGYQYRQMFDARTDSWRNDAGRVQLSERLK